MQLAALVLLGCRIEPGSDLPAAAGRRVQRAADAFRQGLAPRILVCGGKRWAGVAEAQELARALCAAGVAGDALERETRSQSTFQNARFAAELLLPRGQSRIGLVTCDWHMRRALRCFEWAGFEATPIPARTPDPGHLLSMRRVVRERTSLLIDAFQAWTC